MAACWWCCHTFDGTALHWPYKFKSNVFSTTGYFCSWGCMKAYAFDKGRTDTYEFIVLMKKRIETKIGSAIVRAPKKECLKMFGGQMSIEEFRGIEKPIFVSMPNEYFQIPIISNTNFVQLKSKQEDTDQLQLKRVKPLDRSKGKLERVLNKCSTAAKNEKKNSGTNSKTEQK